MKRPFQCPRRPAAAAGSPPAATARAWLAALALAGLLGLAGCASLDEAAGTEDAPEEGTADTEEESEASPEPEDSARADEPDEEPVREAAEPEPEPEPDAEAPRRGLSGDNLYRLLVAELAGQRGDLDTALSGYLEVAAESTDPRVAERAARTARYLERPGVAIEAAERWVELRPEEREAHAMLARLNLGIGEVERAVVHLRGVVDYTADGRRSGLREAAALLGSVDDPGVVTAAIEQMLTHYPEAAVLHYSRARHAERTDDRQAALAAVEQALALEPGHVRAQILQARLLAADGREEEAIRALETAREAQPEERDLALAHVRLLVDLERTEAAVETMQAVFEQFGDDGRVVRNLALNALQLEAAQDARIYLERQLAIGAATDEARYYLGRLAQEQGHCDRAMSHYLRVGGDEYRFDAQRRFAVCLAEVGRLAEARRHLDGLRRQHQGSDALAELSRTEAMIERDADNLDRALQVLSETVEAQPEQEDVRYLRALTAAQADRFELARSDLEWLLERNPERPDIQNALGYTLADAGVELDRARRLIEQALAERPEDAAVLDSMGWVLYRQGEYREALDYLREAWAQSPDAEIGAHLGEVLWVLDRREEARAIWDEAAAEDPGHAVLRETRERLAK